MSPTDLTGIGHRVPATMRTLAAFTLVVFAVACSSDTDTTSATLATGSDAAPVETEVLTNEAPTSEATTDAALAEAALLTTDDLDGDWREVPDFSNSAELARGLPTSAGFVDLVFQGGAQHGSGTTVTLERTADSSLLYTYVVVFPSSAEAAALVAAFKSSEFDGCWADFMEAGVLAYPQEISEANYEKAEPPEMTFVADSYVARALSGTLVIDGSEFSDSCVCVYAQVDRAAVLTHSAEAHFSPEDRIEFTQAGIDKLRNVIG